ncbi:MAG: hydrogen-dependent growth transcriptional repressor [Desulfuromonas sp.]|nr:MAG: hydrogen-dependent growth transcriptional repressor [Desulfuromonas sp.]
MGKRADNAKKFIISCRVNNQEMDQLQNLAKESGDSISALLRKSLVLLQSDTDGPRLSA